MNAGMIALILGLFIVPVVLLYLGHRLRRRPKRTRGIFWGALAGHTIGALFATWYSMIPPEAWTSSDTTRGFFGLYGMLAGSLIGMLAGLVLSRD